MKLSSSTLCGCCFCCYCHSWLMMLLMVSSVVHVSPEMSTLTKKYTKLNNNHYYQNKMTELTQLDKKIPHRTSRTVTTLKSPSTATTIIPPVMSSRNNDYKENKMNIYPTLEHDTITTIATIQTQSTITSSTTIATKTTMANTTPKTAKSATTSTPQQLQMTKLQNLYDTTTKTATTIPLSRTLERTRQVNEGVLHLYDNSIADATTTAYVHVPTATDNYVADKNVFMQPTIARMKSTKPLEIARHDQQQISNAIITTNTKTIQITRQDDSSSSNMSERHNTNTRDNWNTSIELSSNNKQQQKRNTSDSSESNRVISNDNNMNNNINKNIYGTINNSGSNRLLNRKIQKLHKIQTENTALTISTNFNSIQNTTIISVNNNNNTNTNESSTKDNTLNNNISTMSSSKNHKTSPSSNPSNKKINFSYSTYNLQIPATTTTSSSTTSIALQKRTTSPTDTPSPHHYNQLIRPALLHRNIRQATDDDKCRMFDEGDAEKNELYSPDYPNDYPKNINCTRIITAPKGQIIRLDFRNSFHIEEKEECKFDFLEIRDGQYGFSNLIGKYCGTDFPPEITSKERYLWLHFHSDESIEYSGFTAVYEFIDRNRDAPSTDLNCTIEKSGYEGFVNSSDVPAEIKDNVKRNKIPLDCMWRIQVQDKWKIQVKFVDFKLAKPNDCETNFLDIFPEQTVMPLRVKNFCGSAGEGITSDSNILHMRFYAEQIAINSTFSILFTAFRDRGAGCVDLEYDCEDNTCIGPNLTCNGHDNCKFRWDEEEEGCKQTEEGQSEHMKIIISVFCVILGGMVLTFLVNCIRKVMHDQKIIREHIRQSRESKLDEMGRNSKARSRDNISIVSPRQKHSQTSLQILDDVSNRYYREMELQSKGNFKEKDPSILRHHDMIVQTSLCSTDDSSTTITEQQQQTPTTVGAGGACDMGCQTRESLFATASLMRQKSTTPSMAGSQRIIEGVPPPPRFSTFGYDAAQIAPPPPPTVSTLSRRNMHLPQESFEMEQLPQQTTHMMMPNQQQQQQQHQHLHHRPSQEICHHHHQHQQHLQQQQQQQQQKQTLPRHQQQQQQQHHHPHLQHQQQQQHHHHTAVTTIPPNITQLSQAPGTTVVTAISTGTSGRQREQGGGNQQGGKNKQTKLDESKVFIDIRNSAPDVIIMTSH